MKAISKFLGVTSLLLLLFSCGGGGEEADPVLLAAPSLEKEAVGTAYHVMIKPTDWKYIDEVYDSNDPYRRPLCGVPCRGEVADGKPKKCRFGDYCDGLDTEPYHAGIDYQDRGGSNYVFSAAAGIVVRVVRNGDLDHGLGNTVIIKHYCRVREECGPNGVVYTLYAHMEGIAFSVREGAFVRQKQKIGLIGKTGSGIDKYSQHLHFEVKKAPVLQGAISNSECMATGRKFFRLIKYPRYTYGYSPQSNPEVCGYFDPEKFIGKVEIIDFPLDSIPKLEPLDGFAGEYGILGFGYAQINIAEAAAAQPPDYVATAVTLQTPWKSEIYRFGLSETIRVEAQFENVGTGEAKSGSPDIEVHFYLSKGFKEDAHSKWKRIGKEMIKPENLKPGETKKEHETLIIGKEIAAPGIWNIVACIDHPKDNHNNGGAIAEEHESNNCSTEAVFEVTGNAVENVKIVDLTAHSLSFLQAPVFAGDLARFSGFIKNSGTAALSSGIRSNYSVQCAGSDAVYLTDDGTDADDLKPGVSAYEENNKPVQMPNLVGSCTAYLCADSQSAIAEYDETNNCTSLEFSLAERPAANLVIVEVKDEDGCCTTNTGERIKPKVTVRNDGQAAPLYQYPPVVYQISSPVATGGAYVQIGSGSLRTTDLGPGATDTDKMDGNGWPIPKSSAWKKQWHQVRACIRSDGGQPTGDPALGDICMNYVDARYSKK